MATIGSLTDRDLPAAITDTAHSVGDKVRDRIDGVGSKLSDLTSKAQSGVMDAKDRIQHTAMDAKDRVAGAATDFQKNSRQMVKENPIMAVAIGVGVGFLLGRVLFR